MIVGEREKGGGWWVRGRGSRMVGERERGGGWWVKGRGGEDGGWKRPQRRANTNFFKSYNNTTQVQMLSWWP